MWDRPDMRPVRISTSNSCAAAKKSTFSVCGSPKTIVSRVMTYSDSSDYARNVRRSCAEKITGSWTAALRVFSRPQMTNWDYSRASDEQGARPANRRHGLYLEAACKPSSEADAWEQFKRTAKHHKRH